MAVVLILHLSDAHLRNSTDPLVRRIESISRAVAAESDGSVAKCIIAFTGDATDKGFVPGFLVARAFLIDLANDITAKTGLEVITFTVPGNHDVTLPADPSLRDVAISSIASEVSASRPKGAIESAILSAMDGYFELAESVAPNTSIVKACPYYKAVTIFAADKRLRFHLVNSSWMCNRGQSPGSLLFPVDEIKVPTETDPVDYEITLIHHPFPWFKQPEVMRPLRDAVESLSDMILTGHEHVGRSVSVTVHGSGAMEYREGEPLFDELSGASGFHLLRLDLRDERQTVSTFKWKSGVYERAVGPVEGQLGRNRLRARQPHRLRSEFADYLDDPELPVLHTRGGKLRLSDFYTYPDLKTFDDSVERQATRIRGEHVVATIADNKQSLIIGPDRSGKTSICKRLFADIHKIGALPLLLDGKTLKNERPERVNRLIEKLVGKQYETMSSQAYFQADSDIRVLLIDDLHLGPTNKQRRTALIKELEKHFSRIVIVGAEEFYYDEMLCLSVGEEESAFLGYSTYRILPFGYLRCNEFVKSWVKIAGVEQEEYDEKVTAISGVLTQFLRNNLVPQYPWVVLIIVQQADSPQPLHAENGSYGHLLHALITAALSKSRLNLPINGKYTWLGEFANELYSKNVDALSEQDARDFHERHRAEYGLQAFDFKEVRDDLANAGVLKVDHGDLSFRQPYTFCYFVAWHLAQRLHSNESGSREEVRRLCDDLYHEDTANVLVFLAHLTTSHVVLEEMTAHAARLFSSATETDLATDVIPINNLYSKVQSLILPHGDPSQNKRAIQDEEDSVRADRDSAAPRKVTLRPTEEERSRRSAKFSELVTAVRTIEILGQVLRNEATARKVSAMLDVSNQVFRLARRLLGFAYALGGDSLDTSIAMLREYYRHTMPEAKAEEIVNEVSRMLFNRYTFFTFAVVKQLSQALGERNLREVFRKLVQNDPNLANRVCKLGIDLAIATKLPLQDVEALNDELGGTAKGADGKKSYNNLAHTVVRSLVVDYMYLNHVPQQQVQALCNKLNIEVPAAVTDPNRKRLPPGK